MGIPAARCQGRGEHLSPASHPWESMKGILVAYPGFPSATGEAFRLWRNESMDDHQPDIMKPGPFPGEPAPTVWLRNDLAPGVMGKFPFLRLLGERMASHKPECLGMTGSGSALFSLFEDCRAGEDACADLEGWLGPGGQVRLCRWVEDPFFRPGSGR